MSQTDNRFWNGAAAARDVADWRAAVQAFFSHDWESLRTMILKLEEQSWGGDEMHPARTAQHLAASTPPPKPAETTAAAARPAAQNQRLQELARSIEERMHAPPAASSGRND
jgi:hypothetical protein